jgi:hypothetical protein
MIKSSKGNTITFNYTDEHDEERTAIIIKGEKKQKSNSIVIKV